MPTPLEAAHGRWFEILTTLGGVDPGLLTGKHGPCPACGGEDRFRYDDKDGNGSWYCNQCGGKNGAAGGAGSGIDLLMRVRGWDFKEARIRVSKALGTEPEQRPVTTIVSKHTRPARIPSPPPPGTEPPPLGRAVAHWCYTDTDGQQLFWIQRINLPEGKKLFVHRTWLDGHWHWPSRDDGFTSEWPAPRPVYGLYRLTLLPSSTVLVVEGEGTADAATTLFPDHVVLSWCGGAGGVNSTDWTPLRGRSVFLWPDNDAAGRRTMTTIGNILLNLGCSVTLADVPADKVPPKWDLADAVRDGWTPDQAAASLTRISKPITPSQLELVELKPTGNGNGPGNGVTPPGGGDGKKPSAEQPFTCLGFDPSANGSSWFQVNETGQIINLSASNLKKGPHLFILADRSYWLDTYSVEVPDANQGTRLQMDWDAATNDLQRKQAEAGIFDASLLRGRGAWLDEGRTVLHLGNQLIVDGVRYPITSPPPSRFSYQRLANLTIPPGTQSLTCDEGLGLLMLSRQFLWEIPASGVLLAGWCALAHVCGSLPWRPHLWITAPSGSGKSVLLDRFVGNLLGDLALWPEGNTTEAFIRQELRCDARAVVMDEAESNEQKDKQRIQDILALARVASSSGRGVIGKGGADGRSQRYVIRSMFALCSINTALKQGADQSRFAQLTLLHPTNALSEERAQQHWLQLDRDLNERITDNIHYRLMLRSVNLIPVINEAIKVFRQAATQRFKNQRLGDQYGTLLAGAWSLMRDTVPSMDEALAMIDEHDWEPYRENVELSDQQRCLHHILQHQVRIDMEDKTLYQLVEVVRDKDSLSAGLNGSMQLDTAIEALGRHGLKVADGFLYVHNTTGNLRRILSNTNWTDNWKDALQRLHGALKVGPTRFKTLSGVSRATAIPLETIDV